MNFKQLTKSVDDAKQEYGSATPDEIFEKKKKGEEVLPLIYTPLGAYEEALKGFIMKYCRIISVVINSDLPKDIQLFVKMHEASHLLLGHLEKGRTVFFKDSSFAYQRDHTDLAKKENEANFFTADYLIDTREAIEAIHELDIFSAARALRVPPELLDYKLRLLYGLGKLDNYQDCLSVRSDCMRTLRSGLPNSKDLIIC